MARHTHPHLTVPAVADIRLNRVAIFVGRGESVSHDRIPTIARYDVLGWTLPV